MNAIQLWWLSLALGAVVIVVVAVLLGLIIATAKNINQQAGRIWTVGKEIAGNTVSIWLLADVKEHLLGLDERAKKIERAAARLGNAVNGPAGGGQ